MLSKKSVVITGAGSGIGKATALAAGIAGAHLTLADYDLASVEETARLVNQAGGRAIAVHCDVSVSRDVEAMVAAAVAEFGAVHGAFNNAGIAQSGTTTIDCAEDVYDRVMAVNAKGVWLCLKHVIRSMLASGGGAIVTNASISGIRAHPNAPAYIASKHAAVGLSQGAALEFGRQGIRVNCICPGPIHTRLMEDVLASLVGSEDGAAEQFALPGRWGTPEEVATAVVWLLSDASNLINGVTLPLDGGKLAA